MLGLAVVVGLAMSVDVKFTYEDSSSGTGYFAINNKITAKGPHTDPIVTMRSADMYLQKKKHGSGSLEKESIIISNGSTKKHISSPMIYAFGLIAALDDHSMIYGPHTMSVGSGYYSTHPVYFDSLLSDKTQIKNYASKTSIGHEINYAQGINMFQLASVEDAYLDMGDIQGLGRTLMNLEGGVTNGTAHLEVQQGGIRKWSNPDIDIYEAYTGNFDFATKMNLTVPVYKSLNDDYPWLSCCFGGEDDMIPCDKKGLGADEKGVFECISDFKNL